MLGRVRDEGNKIFIEGRFSLDELPAALATMHSTVNFRGYSDIVLDFSRCEATFAGPMLAVIARVQDYWNNSIDVHLELPSNENLKRLFINANWAHLIDFQHFEESRFRGHSHIPATKFRDGPQQHSAVSRILDSILAALSDFDRSDLRAIEWSINEITDNVINHSESAVGGFVQVTNFTGAIKRVEFAVCDAGIGIPTSLRSTHSEIRSDEEALDKAIRHGVTRDRKVGQGNGLYGTWKIVEMSGGRFDIYSGYSSLNSSPRAGLHIRTQQVPFNGALVVASIRYAQPVDLVKALVIDGKAHSPVDYIETKYEIDEAGNIEFLLAMESDGFGSRAAGQPVRAKLYNLARLAKDKKIVIDFSDVAVISSSYADEVLGKLFLEMGPIQFSQTFEFRNTDSVIRKLIDKAILQRSATGAG